ncbi:MAG TPA: acyl-CoA dehydrogenase family protein [Turneriella sp.]|nr:acyl-CoA dehydrogenase family protein [Turneriella sp.]
MIQPNVFTGENPGLKPFDLSTYTGTKNKNFFTETPILFEAFELNATNTDRTYLEDVKKHLSGLGHLLGGVVDELTVACHREGKWGELVQFDKFGNRIDEIRYSSEQRELRKIFYDYGVVNLDCHEDWKHEFSTAHRMALATLSNMNGEGGVSCPFAMTEGIVHAIRALGTDEQKERYLPMLTDPASSSHLMAGQYVTERVGGSNVAANRTIATEQKDGTWLLNGEKWYCSNPGDLWVTTAKIQGTNVVGLFLVARLKRDGSLNGCRLLRKKEILGSKGKLTVESVYENCEATALGRPSHGLANLIRYILRTSRLHVVCGGLGHIARGILEAEAYVSQREAYGAKLVDFPSVRRTLDEIKMLQTALTLVSFRAFRFAADDDTLELLMLPLMKVVATQYSAMIVKEAIILHGGNGILEDFSVLPRVLNDAIINETWEGTHALLAENALRALKRPKVRASMGAYFEKEKKILPQEVLTLAETFLADIDAMMASEHDRDVNRMLLCEKLWRFFALIEMERWVKKYPSAAHTAQAKLLLTFVNQNARMPYKI